MLEDFTQVKIDTDYGVETAPPLIQWRRGDLVSPNALLKNGCWQLPVEQWEMFVDRQPVDVLHSGGTVVPSYLFGQLQLAVLAYRKRWYLKAGEETTWLDDYVEGARSRIQTWCYVKEINQFAIITVSGMNAKYFSDAVNGTLTRQIVTPASRFAKQAFARFHFWLPMATAGKIATKNNEYVTPPACPVQSFNVDILRGLFVGSKVATLCEEEMPLAKNWAMSKDEADATQDIDSEDTTPQAHPQQQTIDPLDEYFPRDNDQPVDASYDEDEIPF